MSIDLIEKIQTFKPVLIFLPQWAIVLFFRFPQCTIELICFPQWAIDSVCLPQWAIFLVRLPEWTIGVQLESAGMAHGNEIIHRYLTTELTRRILIWNPIISCPDFNRPLRKQDSRPD